MKHLSEQELKEKAERFAKLCKGIERVSDLGSKAFSSKCYKHFNEKTGLYEWREIKEND